MRAVSLTVVALGVLALAGTASAAASEYDLKWIGSLPGVSGSVRKTSPGEHKAVYSVKADIDDTFQKVRDGLTQRGWTVGEATGVNVAGTVVKALQADKGSAHVKVAATGTTGAINLDVHMEGAPREGGSAAPAGAGAGSGGGSGGGVVAATKGDISIAQGNVHKTYRCDGSHVSIFGGDCQLVLQGECADLSITGGHNVVKVEGTIGPISVTGAGNKVTWSAQKNPTAPQVSQIGANNEIHAE